MRRTAIALVLMGCGGAAPAQRALLIVDRSADLDAVRTEDPELTIEVGTPAPDSALAAIPERLEAARQLFLRLELDESLAQVRAIQIEVENAADDPAAAELLARVHLLRGMNELGRAPESADAAFRAAAEIRPELELDPERYPPEARDAFDRARAAVRAAAPSALTVRSAPSGAEVRFDGNEAGQTPLTLHPYTGRHAVHLEMLGYRPAHLIAEIADRAPAPLEVELVAASRADVIAQLFQLRAPEQIAPRSREALRAALGVDWLAVIRAEGDESVGWSLRLDDSATENARGESLATLLGSLGRRRPVPPDDTPLHWGIAVAVTLAVLAAGALAAYALWPRPHQIVLDPTGG